MWGGDKKFDLKELQKFDLLLLIHVDCGCDLGVCQLEMMLMVSRLRSQEIDLDTTARFAPEDLLEGWVLALGPHPTTL